MFPPIAVVPLLDTDLFSREKYWRFFGTTLLIIAVAVMVLFSPLAARDLAGNPAYGVNIQEVFWDLSAALASLNPFTLLIALGSNLWVMLRATFVHRDAFHLLGNMVLVFALGPSIEARLGRGKYLLIFFGTGVFAMAAMTIVFSSHSPGLILEGASASAFGLAGAFFALRPRAKLAGMFLVGLSDWALPIPFSLPAKWLLGLLLACEIGRGLSQLELSMLAHLAGFICGYLSVRITLSEAKAEEASL